jgi:hypothetical protein
MRDKDGIALGVGQRLPVWFLPGTPLASSGTRTLVIPAGAALLFTPAATFNGNNPGASTEAELRADLDAKFLDQISLLEVSIDGMPIPDVKKYRVQTPVFTTILAPDNFFGIPIRAGRDPRLAAVADGYWLMLPPLSAGKHVLVHRQEGTDVQSGAPYKQEWTFNLIMQEPNKPLQ